MKKIGIMADSHSGILKQEAEELDIHVLPMPFYLNGELFHEDLDFSRTGFYEKLREGADVSTSQPSPQEVMEMWDEMLLSYDQILYIPLSSRFKRFLHDCCRLVSGTKIRKQSVCGR